jgi:PTH1 family peptidyl-tRNA hydrolase
MGVAPEHRLAGGKDYLLSPMRKAQLEMAAEAVESCSQAVRMILTQGASAAMNRFNQKVDGAGQAE